MSSLKIKLRQPEAWLKEVLAKIAVLVRSGTAANHYTLAQENQMVDEDWSPEVSDMKVEMAPEEADVEMGVDDDDDEDLKFEDA